MISVPTERAAKSCARCNGLACSRSAERRLRQVGAVFIPPPKAATPVRRMQKDQLQAEHTTPPGHSGHRALARPLCCHKESAVTSRSSLLSREPSKRYRCQFLVFETSSATLPEVQPPL